MGAVSEILELSENQMIENMRPKRPKECKTLFICPECKRVYQTMRGNIMDEKLKKGVSTRWEEY